MHGKKINNHNFGISKFMPGTVSEPLKIIQ
jgi:hypothetical protein